MVLGYKLFNQLGLYNSFEGGKYRILTNRIGAITKHLGNAELIRYDTIFFDSATEFIITALELIDYGYETINKFYGNALYILIMEKVCKSYTDWAFKEKANYSYSVYDAYANLLKFFKVKNKVREIASRSYYID